MLPSTLCSILPHASASNAVSGSPCAHDRWMVNRSLAWEQVERDLHGCPCHQAVLHLRRHAQPRPRPGRMGVTADSQLALAFENMDDRRSRRRVLRKLLARGEGEEQELDVALVRERLTQDASGRDGRLGGQIGEEGVGRGHVSTRWGLPDRDYL